VLAEQYRKPYDPGSGFGIHSGDIVLDCGANVGAYTRQALDEGARLVVAIEPVPPNVECLRRTFAKEIEAGRVIVCPKGAWDKDDTLPMWVYPNSVLDSFVMKDRYESETRPRQIQLPLTTIDHLMTELKLPRVDFLKMDIEGAEANALTGARETLAKYKPRMAIATENLTEQQRTIPELVTKLGLGYRARAGCCMSFRRDIRPEVFFFY
jgi:FkbM family methyltransferase